MYSDDLPAYSDLILPTVRAVAKLGGSATAREITTQVLEDLAPTDEMLAVARASRPESSVHLERDQWARSYAKPIGALESPKAGRVPGVVPVDADEGGGDIDEEEAILAVEQDVPVAGRWQDVLVARLHRLSPDGFEKFVLYLLGLYGWIPHPAWEGWNNRPMCRERHDGDPSCPGLSHMEHSLVASLLMLA